MTIFSRMEGVQKLLENIENLEDIGRLISIFHEECVKENSDIMRIRCMLSTLKEFAEESNWNAFFTLAMKPELKYKSLSIHLPHKYRGHFARAYNKYLKSSICILEQLSK